MSHVSPPKPTATSAALDQPPPVLNPTPSAPEPKPKTVARSVSPVKKKAAATAAGSNPVKKTAKKAAAAPVKDHISASHPVPEKNTVLAEIENVKAQPPKPILSDPPLLKPTAPAPLTIPKTRKVSRSASPVNTSKASTSTADTITAPVPVKRKASSTTTKKVMASKDTAGTTTPPLVDNLKSQLRKAEIASEKYQKQLLTLQSRLDDALGGQARLQKTANARAQKFELLENDQNEADQERKSLESAEEASQASPSAEESSATKAREEELNKIILRLQDTLAQREPTRSQEGFTRPGMSRKTSYNCGGSPAYNRSTSPSAASDPMDSSHSVTRLILQKEKAIEELRMDLTESHMRFVEITKADDRRIRELELDLRASKLDNSRLRQDREHYQMLLQEQDMKRAQDRRGAHRSATGSAEGLGDHNETMIGGRDSEMILGLESQVSSLQDQNSALTLYVNRIITRLLDSENFEGLFEESSVTGDNPLNMMKFGKSKSGLVSAGEDDRAKENTAPLVLKHAGSLLGGRTMPRPGLGSNQVSPSRTPPAGSETIVRPPNDAILATRPIPHPNEDPNTSTSIPLRRAESRRRAYRISSSESTATNYPYKRDPSVTGSSRQSSDNLSPGIGSSSHRASYFGTGPPAALIPVSAAEARASRATSDSGYETMTHTSNSTAHAGDSYDARSISGSSNAIDGKPATSTFASMPVLTSAGPGTPNRMRTLRLVQEKVDADEAAAAAATERKNANRSSWIGWFGKNDMPPPPPPHRTQPHWPGAPAPPRVPSPVKGRVGSGGW